MAKKNGLALANRDRMKHALAIYEGMMDGQSDVEIMDDLDLDSQTFMLCKKFLLQMKANEIDASTSGEVFGRYLIAQEQNIGDLNDLIRNLNHKSQYNALVGAIRLRADITDRIVTTGQTLGMIDKEPEKKVIIAGINVHEMKDRDLKRGVVKAVAGLQKLISRYGDTQKLGDMEIEGSLHYGEKAKLPQDEMTAVIGPPVMDKKKKPKGKARAKSHKRSAGRRRVRD